MRRIPLASYNDVILVPRPEACSPACLVIFMQSLLLATTNRSVIDYSEVMALLQLREDSDQRTWSAAVDKMINTDKHCHTQPA